jgi:hypothetical protein
MACDNIRGCRFAQPPVSFACDVFDPGGDRRLHLLFGTPEAWQRIAWGINGVVIARIGIKKRKRSWYAAPSSHHDHYVGGSVGANDPTSQSVL